MPFKRLNIKTRKGGELVIFLDNQHNEFYNNILASTKSQTDPERKALFYLLGLTPETRKNINQLYDFEENCIKLEGLKQPWQTGSTIRVCRLAFNLYNGTCGQHDDSGDVCKYTPYRLFGGDLTPYMLEAVKIRYSYINPFE